MSALKIAAESGECVETSAQPRRCPGNAVAARIKAHEAKLRLAIADFEKLQLYSYSVNPESGTAIGMPSIEAINEGGRGAIGTPADALHVLENYWSKTGGFGCILLLAHDWAEWEATKRSYELYARFVMPHISGVNRPRQQSFDRLREDFEAVQEERQKGVDMAFAKWEEHAQANSPSKKSGLG